MNAPISRLCARIASQYSFRLPTELPIAWAYSHMTTGRVSSLVAECDHLRDPRVHPADYIDVGRSLGRSCGPFVVDRPGGIVILNPCGHGGVVRAAAALVAQRPEDHGRMVLVPLDHADRPLHEGRVPVGDVGEQAADAVRFEIGLVHQVDAVLVAQVVPARVVGIVRGPHGVDVVALHQLDVLDHPADRDRSRESGSCSWRLTP